MIQPYTFAREPKRKRAFSTGKRRLFVILTLVALVVGLALWSYRARPAIPPMHSMPEFALFQEFFGQSAYLNPEVKQNLDLGMLNGLALPPPLAPGLAQTTHSYRGGLILRLPASASVAETTDSAIEQQHAILNKFAKSTPGDNYFWNLMPGWDQSGGKWVPRGRPRYTGLSRSAALKAFRDYYCHNAPQLSRYLQESSANRRYRFASVTEYSPNVFEAYEMGVELQFLERGSDELGDLSTGIAYLRGAATQYDRPWGIDLSSWRTANNRSTNYDASGKLTGGWSADYLRRHLFLAYMAGAQAVQVEPSTYRLPDGHLNPFGQAMLEFSEFALRRHSDIGKPLRAAALMIPPASGFDPKHGPYDQAPYVWYRDIPYTPGDFMLDNLLQVAYPNHWSFGLAPGAPFSNPAGLADPEKFRSYLEAGGDARMYEPMPFTRWGDNLDIVDARASSNALKQYQTVILVGDLQTDSELMTRLSDWVAGGGTLVLFGSQVKSTNEAVAGVHIVSSASNTANGAISAGSDQIQVQPAFTYRPVQSVTAQTLVRTDTGYPLITKQSRGSGSVYLVTALHGQAQDTSQVLPLTLKLLDSVIAQKMPAQVLGPPTEYILSTASDKTLVTLSNNSSSTWTGQILFRKPAGDLNAVEYISNQNLTFSATDSGVSVPIQVPPYGVRIIALEAHDPS